MILLPLLVVAVADIPRHRLVYLAHSGMIIGDLAVLAAPSAPRTTLVAPQERK